MGKHAKGLQAKHEELDLIVAIEQGKICRNCRKPKRKCDCGAPTVMTEEKLQKLITSFQYGATDAQACHYAGISPATLYNYCQADPSFLELKQRLKEEPVLLAKRNIVNALKAKDKAVSAWYLERKQKDEFSTRQENINVDLVELTKQTKELEDLGNEIRNKYIKSDAEAATPEDTDREGDIPKENT